MNYNHQLIRQTAFIQSTMMMVVSVKSVARSTQGYKLTYLVRTHTYIHTSYQTICILTLSKRMLSVAHVGVGDSGHPVGMRPTTQTQTSCIYFFASRSYPHPLPWGTRILFCRSRQTDRDTKTYLASPFPMSTIAVKDKYNSMVP